MARKKPKPATTDLDAIRHKDTRVNIPTEELRDFVADDEAAPGTMLYPRDPSLDPQLVWKGKDEQDRQDLAVPILPIYIQEKVQPRAIIETVRAQAAKEQAGDFLPGLFNDFNGIDDFDKKVDFYHHDQHWTNRLILGDSLQVMTSLAEKEGLKGKVQMIYIDPPYGIKFGSNWQVSTRKRDVKDGKAEDATRQPEQIRAFRDTWNLGIHSYLDYLRDRLTVARDLLAESGSIFVQIGDENIHLIRSLLDEIFRSDNFCGIIVYQKTGGFSPSLLALNVDFILWYGKDKEHLKYRALYEPTTVAPEDTVFLDSVEQSDRSRRLLTRAERENLSLIPKDARIFSRNPLTSDGYIESLSAAFDFEGTSFKPPTNSHWKTTPNGMKTLTVANRLTVKGNTLRYVRFLEDFPVKARTCLWTDTGTGGFVGDSKIYVVQTDSRAISRCILMTTDPGDLVLDPTCGSGTTAYVAEQWGRRWITIDTSRVALTLARTRLMAGRFPYHLLADSPEGIVKETELAGQLPPAPMPPTEGDIRKGFVCKRVPHVTLKAIANNEEIDVLHAKWQQRLEPLRAQLNSLVKESWEEWQVPRDPESSWPKGARELLAQWWEARRSRQREIDDSIARHADTETLHDQPYEDKNRIRVTGPFTVESLAPHRVLATEEPRPASEVEGRRQPGPGQFEAMVLDNLRKAGVQNTRKPERLTFDRLEPHAGVWIHATGDYADADGKTRRVAVSIGPEHGTVGPQQVKEAAKEAVQGLGFDLLIVCGFAFDPHVAEETKRYGKLTVQSVRMNPDLSMGDELLKKTGAGNLFMIFGEPDIAITRSKDGTLTVAIQGVDVYDPTTGAIRSSTTDDIACWFLDTNYNGESFFVRHAYFTGADDPYAKLKRALRAEIDEARWAALYSTRSYPFPVPETGKIAVKVINHYGDEVLKVYNT